MTTTVIASRHSGSLLLAPFSGRPLEVSAVRDVLARHGLRLLDGSDLSTVNEFVAAEGLSPADSAALAEDLRAVGLHARVVNRTGLTGSRRVGNAIRAQLLVGMAGLGSLMMGLIPVIDAMKDGATFGPPLAVVPIALGVGAMAWAVVNALWLRKNGGYSLRVAGAERGGVGDSRALTDQLTDLVQDLPDHVAAGLIDKARLLEAHARSEPDGKAATELRALVADLREETDVAAAEDAVDLRAEVARARRAVREAQKG